MLFGESVKMKCHDNNTACHQILERYYGLYLQYQVILCRIEGSLLVGDNITFMSVLNLIPFNYLQSTRSETFINKVKLMLQSMQVKWRLLIHATEP
jgi:hypothetical protein